MLEILKKIGLTTTVATIVVVLLTFVPLYYQYKATVDFDARLTAIEKQLNEKK